MQESHPNYVAITEDLQTVYGERVIALDYLWLGRMAQRIILAALAICAVVTLMH